MIPGILAAVLSLQGGPFEVLSDPSARADSAARAKAAAAFRAKSAGSPVHYVAARFLERDEKSWGLDEAAKADLDAWLAGHWKTVPATPEAHKAALKALVELYGKHASGKEAFGLFAQAHLSVLGDRAALQADALGYTKEGDRWGTADGLPLYQLAQGFAKQTHVPEAVERAAQRSKEFGPRYAVALLGIRKTLFANSGFEAFYKSFLSSASRVKGPEGEHLRALAESFKKAVSCGACDRGKVECKRCGGSKKTDVRCPICKGLGWQSKGNQANVLIKCRYCKGAKVFRGAGCPDCKRRGTLGCPVCLGKGWRENFKGCADCKVCGTCGGRRRVDTPCGTCQGKGRVPPIRLGIPTILCDGCKGKAIFDKPCTDCQETGIADCGTCGGKGPRDGKSDARPKLPDIFESVPCDGCAGKGWPLPNLAVPCASCSGLGFRAVPVSDPSKVLK